MKAGSKSLLRYVAHEELDRRVWFELARGRPHEEVERHAQSGGLVVQNGAAGGEEQHRVEN